MFLSGFSNSHPLFESLTLGLSTGLARYVQTKSGHKLRNIFDHFKRYLGGEKKRHISDCITCKPKLFPT